jgi:DNA-binding NarL/FixJ family response regulator
LNIFLCSLGQCFYPDDEVHEKSEDLFVGIGSSVCKSSLRQKPIGLEYCYTGSGKNQKGNDHFKELSPRPHELARGLLADFSIAHQLNLSKATIHAHVKERLREKDSTFHW